MTTNERERRAARLATGLVEKSRDDPKPLLLFCSLWACGWRCLCLYCRAHPLPPPPASSQSPTTSLELDNSSTTPSTLHTNTRSKQQRGVLRLLYYNGDDYVRGRPYTSEGAFQPNERAATGRPLILFSSMGEWRWCCGEMENSTSCFDIFRYQSTANCCLCKRFRRTRKGKHFSPSDWLTASIPV